MNTWTKIVEAPSTIVSACLYGDSVTYITRKTESKLDSQRDSWELCLVTSTGVANLHSSSRELGKLRADDAVTFLQIDSKEMPQPCRQLMEVRLGRVLEPVGSLPLDTVGYQYENELRIRWNMLYAYQLRDNNSQKIHPAPDKTLHRRIRASNSAGELAFAGVASVFFYDQYGAPLGVTNLKGEIAALEPCYDNATFYAVTKLSNFFHLAIVSREEASLIMSFDVLPAKDWEVVAILTHKPQPTVVFRERKHMLKKYIFLSLQNNGDLSEDSISGLKNFSFFAPGIVGRIDLLRGVSEVWKADGLQKG